MGTLFKAEHCAALDDGISLSSGKQRPGAFVSTFQNRSLLRESFPRAPSTVSPCVWGAAHPLRGLCLTPDAPAGMGRPPAEPGELVLDVNES